MRTVPSDGASGEEQAACLADRLPVLDPVGGLGEGRVFHLDPVGDLGEDRAAVVLVFAPARLPGPAGLF